MLPIDREQKPKSLSDGHRWDAPKVRFATDSSWSDLGWQREDQMEIAEQIGFASGEPVLRRRALALGAMAVAT
jgi:hypothetical protein